MAHNPLKQINSSALHIPLLIATGGILPMNTFLTWSARIAVGLLALAVLLVLTA